MNTKYTTDDLERMSRLALYDLAKKLKIKGCTRFTKSQLSEAILNATTTAAATTKKSPKVAKVTKIESVPPAKNEKKTAKAANPEKAAKAKDTAAAEPAVKTKKVGRPPRADKAIADSTAVTKPKTTTAKTKTMTTDEKKPARAKPATQDKTTTAAKKTAATAKPAVTAKPATAAKKAAATARPVTAAKPATAAKKTAAAKPAVIPANQKQNAAKSTDADAAMPKKRGRPAKSAKTTAAVTPVADNQVADAKTGAEKRLDRGFAKKADDAPKPRNKKGAEVVQPVVAIPVDLNQGANEAKPSQKAEQIEKDRSQRHASLKTTMEIPIFSPAESGSTDPISEEELTGELPLEYGETKIVMQIRDPHWAHVYWEVPQVELKRFELEVGIFEFAHSHFVLRLHNVSHGHSQEIRLSEHARDWYMYLESSLTVYQVELGLQSPTEGYTFVALSNLVQTPPDKVSPRWAPPVLPVMADEPIDRVAGHELVEPLPMPTHVKPEIARLTEPASVYFSGLTGGTLAHGGSSELLAGQANFPADLAGLPASQPAADSPGSWQMPSSDMPSSHISLMPTSLMPTSPMPTSGDWPSSHSVSSLASDRQGQGQESQQEPQQISLSLAADVIFYGRVGPGCRLDFMGQAVAVAADGSFSLRLALPFDRIQHIELLATDLLTQQSRIIKAKITLNND